MKFTIILLAALAGLGIAVPVFRRQSTNNQSGGGDISTGITDPDSISGGSGTGGDFTGVSTYSVFVNNG